MKYLSVQTFQCGISVSGAATFTGGATINLLALNGATTSSEASLFLGAHGTNEGGQLVLQKGTSNTYAAHLDNYADQFRLLYGTNTGSTGVALAVSLSTRQLILPAYTSTSSFSGTAVGYLAFDSAGNVITVPSPAGAVTSIIAGTGVSVSSATGNVTISIGQSVATSAQVTFDSVITNNNGNGTNIKIGDDAWIGDVNAANTFRVTGAQNGANGYIIFGNANFDALGRSGTGNLTYAGSTVWTAATLTDLSQLTNGPGYITSAALAGYVPTSRTLSINGTSYDLSANRSWTISTVDYTSRLQHQVKAGVAINKGQAVYVTSADGTNMIVGLASNASETTSSKTMGLLDATVALNGFANVVTEGLLAGLDTSSAGSEGDPVWLGTGGNLIYGLANKPYAPAHLVFIGIVTRKNNNNGEIFVKVQNGFELNEIHDVDLKTNIPVNGELLGFNGTLWVNKTIAGWLGYTPANASGTTNYISKFTGSTTLGNSQIFDNGTNVGIGNSSPSQKLDVSGYAKFTSGIILDGGATSHYREFIWNTSGFNRWDLYVYGAEPGSNVGGDLFLARYADNGAYLGNAVIFQRSTGNVGIGTTSPYSKLEITPSSVAWGEGIVINPASGYSAVFYRLEGAQGSNYTGTWAVGKAFSGDGGGELLQVVKNGLTGSAAYRADASQQWKTNGDSIFGFNVGIGTTSPGNKLHIVGAANGSDAGNIRIDSTDQYGGLVINENTTFRTFLGYGNANHIFSNAQSDSTALRAANYLHLGASSVATITINASDNVGIGTTTPYEKLEVNGAISATGAVNGTSAQGHSTTLAVQSGISFLYAVDWGAEFKPLSVQAKTISLETGTGSTTSRLFIDNLGNVGIGTISPGTALAVNGGTAGQATVHIQHTSASGYSGIDFYENTGTHVGSLWHANSAGVGSNQNAMTLAARTPGDKVYIVAGGYDPATSGGITIDAGNVGIGTTAPTNRLQIGSTGSSGYGGNDLVIGNGTQVMAFYQSSTVSTWYTNTSFSLMPSGSGSVGNLGVGTDTPTQRVHVSGNLRVTGAFYDSNNQAGSAGQILKSTGSGTDWVSLSEITGVDGSGTANYVTKWSDADTVTNSLIYDNGTNVGIGTTSPGYNFDVNGQVRVQDKLRVGTVNSGNGVVHMSSSATINPNTTTIVWAQNVSVGMCAFIEYYILNNNSLTDQRAGTIMVTWNQSGTPTIAHTETTTPDIGSTIAVNFTSSLVGADARINAVNSSANPYTIVMSYKYF